MREQTDLTAEARWEAGDSGCGQLIVGLRRALDGVDAGERLAVVALNAGAPADIPAWCRVTGNELLLEDHPTYIILKKGD
jgi:tRNA 2-thiouridine synthesizing protein A